MSEPSREVLIAMIRRARVMVIDQWEGAYGYVPPDEAATIADAILALRAAKPERERVEPAELEIFIADKSAERAAGALTKEFVITRRRALKGTPP